MADSLSIVILPGMDGTGYPLAEFADHLSQRHSTKVISYPCEIALNENQLLSFVEERLPDSKCIIIGESFSGPLAIQTVAQNNHKFIGLILVSSFAKSPVPAIFSLFVGLVPVKYIPRFISTWLLLGKNAEAKNMATLSKALSAVSKDVFTSRIQTLLSYDKTQEAASIRCPVLHITGSYDKIISQKTVRHSQQYFRQCTLVKIDGPHMLLTTHAKEVASVTYDFISTLKI